MITLLNKIDKYLCAQEKKDCISLSSNKDLTLDEAIKIVNESEDKDFIINNFNKEIKEKLIELREGGII